MLTKVNIDESEFIKKANIIIIKDYTEIDVKVGSILTKMYQGKKKMGNKRYFQFY